MFPIHSADMLAAAGQSLIWIVTAVVALVGFLLQARA